MSKWYGSINNRMEENRQFVPTIEVGTGMTEYLWSDRHPYEVVKVIDQKHVVVREMGHTLMGEAFSNNWRVESNPDAPLQYITKRGKYWYWTTEWMDEQTGKKKRSLYRANVSFGVAEYYYDYSF